MVPRIQEWEGSYVLERAFSELENCQASLHPTALHFPTHMLYS